MSTTEQLSNERLQLLSEALEMLEDMKIKMALFERQHYSKLKAKAEKVVKRGAENPKLSLFSLI